MDALALREVGHMFSCCEPCVRNRRCKQVILIISFVLMTFDMVTDWLNWIQWSGVGGYDQYYFVSIFERLFLCVAAVGTGLWIIQIFVIIKKWINIYHGHPQRIPSTCHRNFHEFLPKPDFNYSLFESQPKIVNDDKTLSELKIKNDKPGARNDNKLPSELEVRNASDPDTTVDDKSSSELDTRNNDKLTSEQMVRNDDKSIFQQEVKNDDYPPCQQEIRNNDTPTSEQEVRNHNKPRF